MNKDRQKRLSKFLSMVLRHKPETIDITLDQNGWTNVRNLIIQMNKYKKTINLETLELIVDDDNKKRYSFNQNKTKIRANQGHSLSIDLGYIAKSSQDIPKILYHGTAKHFAKNILQSGSIQKMKRHHVHLSADIKTAKLVGQRHGKPIVFSIDTNAMINNGHTFYQSDNGVWLTEEVPIQFVQLIENLY